MSIFTRLARKNRDADPASWEALYEAAVVRRIRVRYSQNAENAILRKAIAGIGGDEFSAYNAFVEQCKAEAKAELGIT